MVFSLQHDVIFNFSIFVVGFCLDIALPFLILKDQNISKGVK